MPFRRLSQTTPQLIVAPLAGVAILAMLSALSGCTAIANALHKQHEETFATYADAQKGWVGVAMPEWIPSDATAIHNLATTNEIDSVVRVTSSRPLSTRCVEVDRIGLPFASSGSIPELTTLPDKVQRCGDYEVMPWKDGWLGWYQGLAAGETPAPGLDATPAG